MAKWSKWLDFEIECTKYLNEKFNNYAHFIHTGSSNSTISDIKVVNKKNEFFIDVKQCPAQCGQFVLFPDLDSNTFKYSTKNTHPINQYSSIIIEHMNSNFNDFKESSTSGKNISFKDDTNVFTNWITLNSKIKNVHFFITNNFLIIPVDQLKNYFHVTAKYRIKRSGSSSPGKKNFSAILNYLNSTNYEIQSLKKDAGRLFIKTEKTIHGQHFKIGSNEFMFSSRNSIYEIRKLSKTFNANVIFSINLKKNKQGITTEEFIKYLC